MTGLKNTQKPLFMLYIRLPNLSFKIEVFIERSTELDNTRFATTCRYMYVHVHVAFL